MARGPRKHLKRITAPKHWMLDKLTGVFAPRPSAGPHKLRECIPLLLLIRNRLKYALTYSEAKVIMNSRSIKVDGKIRTDVTYPCGFMDVLSIEKTGEHFRLLHDTKGRFVLHRLTQADAQHKLCRVKSLGVGINKVPYIVTHDGRTIRYPDPLIKPNDTVQIDLATNTIIGFSKFEVGNVCAITGGHNIGRVGIIQSTEKHPGSHNIVHIKDKTGATWATRQSNVFVLATGKKPEKAYILRTQGIKHSIIEEQRRRQDKSNKN
ncbi:small subunit ribosomal protein S4e, cytoplasmic [Guillardia theta CCMP2712]|uniref:40S ribosomal protein S4 n=2 Tax=Guillardia theta TaxID=55529 RepID=L1J6G7_GUITC|nr:small subunit ribosomal protein S4e, cytoplasmic [Guillardia theta CCMP2712]EKX43680.1 small subunit ribosomal protein S4e, cytoplasmic [Guillardia theta CCMP2712]|eukprot:XP_005830660.1 small subunit ribosomal protein S4e, cytoplasmic [Guillardia theta CCMP2712]